MPSPGGQWPSANSPVLSLGIRSCGEPDSTVGVSVALREEWHEARLAPTQAREVAAMLVLHADLVESWTAAEPDGAA